MALAYKYFVLEKRAPKDAKYLVPTNVCCSHDWMKPHDEIVPVLQPHVRAAMNDLGFKLPMNRVVDFTQFGQNARFVDSKVGYCVAMVDWHCRYKFEKISSIEWVQLDRTDPDQNDVWTGYYPPRVCLTAWQHLQIMNSIFTD